MSGRLSPVALGELGTTDPSSLDIVKEEVAESAAEPHKDGQPEPDEIEIPDGGLQAWCTVAGAWLVSLSTFGYMNAYGVYQAYYIETLLPSYSPSAISWIGSVQTLLMLGMGGFSGKLFDKGYFRALIIPGTIIYVGCIFAQSAVGVDKYYQVFLSQGLGQGLATGLLYVPTISVIAHHFRRRRAMAMGMIVMGSSTGGVIFPIMLNNVLQRSSFAWTVRSAGFLILGCLVAANLLMSTRLPPGKAKDQANVLGFFKEPQYVLLLAGIFFVFWGISFPLFYIQLYTSLKVSNQTFAFYTISITNVGSMFGRTLPNLIADRTGPMVLLVPACFITGSLIFAMFGCTYEGAIIVFCLFFGFFSGAFIGLMAPAAANISRSVSEIGARIGIGMSLMGLAALSGTPVVGAIIGSGPDFAWWKGIIFSGVSALAGGTFLAAAWYVQPRGLHLRATGH
ncbi:MFS general substrate transporter [Calocera viscosa TUFC12733]|uniref:MFS general substrate transporter n=1 Tax=Calocera viscosa (strain TUFC12733) TaxID=1330018 RepID=A0A167R244_CALVF|nr:MFS general substrate transporter [Calocera viscosa TUFC12733]